jgi:hypothetical protein
MHTARNSDMTQVALSNAVKPHEQCAHVGFSIIPSLIPSALAFLLQAGSIPPESLFVTTCLIPDKLLIRLTPFINRCF